MSVGDWLPLEDVMIKTICAGAALLVIGMSASAPAISAPSASKGSPPRLSSYDPEIPDCNECVFIPGKDYGDGTPVSPGVWVCPTAQHYAICPYA